MMMIMMIFGLRNGNKCQKASSVLSTTYKCYCKKMAICKGYCSKITNYIL